MGRRKTTQAKVSFFAFQDILFGTIGVILMIMIVLILLVGSAFKTTLEPLASAGDEEKSRGDQLEKQVNELQFEKMNLESLLSTDLSGRESNLTLDLEEIQDRLEELRMKIEANRKQLEQFAKAVKDDGQAARALELMKTRDDLLTAIATMSKNPRVSYQLAKANDRAPIIIELHRGGVILSNTSSDVGETRFDKGNDFEAFARALAGKLASRSDIQSRYLLYVVKPSGILHYETLLRIIKNHPILKELPEGLDLLSESKSTSDFFVQESE